MRQLFEYSNNIRSLRIQRIRIRIQLFGLNYSNIRIIQIFVATLELTLLAYHLLSYLGLSFWFEYVQGVGYLKYWPPPSIHLLNIDIRCSNVFSCDHCTWLLYYKPEWVTGYFGISMGLTIICENYRSSVAEHLSVDYLESSHNDTILGLPQFPHLSLA